MNENLIPINPAEPIENTIRFFNTMNGGNVEVLRISKDGITANPDVPVHEAASAVLRAVDGYLQQLRVKEWAKLIRGVRVEGDTVVVTALGGNDSARELCAALLKEMNQ